MAALRDFYQLSKPGIIWGNLLPVFAGFLLGTHGAFGWELLPAVLGAAFVIASGCAINNAIDGDIDALMERTKNRPVPMMRVTAKQAILFGGVAGIVGVVILLLFTNLLTVFVAAMGWVFYVVFYSLLSKRRTVFAVHIGSVSGAIPPLIGYAAATNRLDLCAVILFLLLTAWQMPHSFAIAIFRKEDYARAGILTVPAKMGMRYARFSILVYVVVFSLLNLALSRFGCAGLIHAINAVILGFVWVWVASSGFRVRDEAKWARRVFFTSIIVIVLSCVTIAFG